MRALVNLLGGYEPLYLEVVKGYAPEHIARYERVLGRALPAAYRDFLETIAANLGFSSHDLQFDLDEVIELAESKLHTLPATFTPIAVDMSPTYTDYYLDRSHAPAAPDGQVVRSGAGSDAFDDVFVDYPSFRDMLFSWGFQQVRMLRLLHRAWVAFESQQQGPERGVPSLDAVGTVLERLGFHSLEVTGETMPLYERGDVAASVVKASAGPNISIFLAADTEAALGQVAETLCDQVPGWGRRHPW